MARRKDYRPGGKRSPTFDGFDNVGARLGMGQDNLLARSGYAPGSYITRNNVELEDMYRTSWVVGRMVDVVAEDMVRGGIDIQGIDSGESAKLLQAYKRTGVPGRLADAIKWGRLYGGALAVVLIDGQDLASPLSLDSIPKGGFKGLHILDRHQVTPSQEKITDLGPMLGYPAMYTVHSEDMQGMSIHHSRAIRFIGIDLPARQRVGEQFWGGSVVDRAYDRILALDSATHGTANLLYRSFLRVLGIDRLRDILSTGGKAEAALHKMLAMIARIQSSEGLTILDGKDTFHTHGWSFAGIYDALQAFAEQIAGATGIPLVRLLGQSPKGFASGESDLRIYYDTILTQEEDDLAGPLEFLFGVLSRSLWDRPLPETFSFSFRSLYQPTELEKSQIATADAQGVAGLHGAGIISDDQALAELSDQSKVTGRYGNIKAQDIAAAKAEASAPPLPEGAQPDKPAQAAQPESPQETPTPQEASMNGAQVASMMEIVTQVAMGQLPRESGVQMLIAAFPVDQAKAERIMGDVGRGFKVTVAEAA